MRRERVIERRVAIIELPSSDAARSKHPGNARHSESHGMIEQLCSALPITCGRESIGEKRRGLCIHGIVAHIALEQTAGLGGALLRRCEPQSQRP